MKYIGIKKQDDKSRGSNEGLIFEQMENGKFKCVNKELRDFEEWEMKHDLELGYLKIIPENSIS